MPTTYLLSIEFQLLLITLDWEKSSKISFQNGSNSNVFNSESFGGEIKILLGAQQKTNNKIELPDEFNTRKSFVTMKIVYVSILKMKQELFSFCFKT